MREHQRFTSCTTQKLSDLCSRPVSWIEDQHLPDSPSRFPDHLGKHNYPSGKSLNREKNITSLVFPNFSNEPSVWNKEGSSFPSRGESRSQELGGSISSVSVFGTIPIFEILHGDGALLFSIRELQNFSLRIKITRNVLLSRMDTKKVW